MVFDVHGKEVMYYELDFLESALKSVKETEECFECVVAMGKTQSVPTLVVGKSGASNALIEPLSQLRDTEGSEIQVSLKNKRDAIQKPKKGEIKFCFFYYISNASYKISLKKKVKKITLDVVTFQDELHLFKYEYSFGDITRVKWSGEKEPRVAVRCHDGSYFENTVMNISAFSSDIYEHLSGK